MRRHSAGFLVGLLALTVGLGCGPRTPPTSGTPIEFTDEGATTRSGHSGPDPKIDVRRDGSRWLVTVYQGQQPSGGYAIRVERATTTGTVLHLRARFQVPPAGAMVTMSLTSPAHTIGLPFEPDVIVLYDDNDRERARLTVR